MPLRYRRRLRARRGRYARVNYLPRNLASAAPRPGKHAFSVKVPVYVSPSMRVRGWLLAGDNNGEFNVDPTVHSYHYYDPKNDEVVDADRYVFDNTFDDKQAVVNFGQLIVQPWNYDLEDGYKGHTTFRDAWLQNPKLRRLLQLFPLFSIKKCDVNFYPAKRRGPWMRRTDKPYRTLITGYGEGIDMGVIPQGLYNRSGTSPTDPGMYPPGTVIAPSEVPGSTYQSGPGAWGWLGGAIPMANVGDNAGAPATMNLWHSTSDPTAGVRGQLLGPMVMHNYEDSPMQKYTRDAAIWDSRRMKHQKTLMMSNIDSGPAGSYYSALVHSTMSANLRQTGDLTGETFPTWIAGGWPFEGDFAARRTSNMISNLLGANTAGRGFSIRDIPPLAFNETDWRLNSTSRTHNIFGRRWKRSMVLNTPLLPSELINDPGTAGNKTLNTDGDEVIDDLAYSNRPLFGHHLTMGKRMVIAWQNVPVEGFMVQPAVSDRGAAPTSLDAKGGYPINGQQNEENKFSLPDSVIPQALSTKYSRLYYNRKALIGYVYVKYHITVAGQLNPNLAESLIDAANTVYEPVNQQPLNYADLMVDTIAEGPPLPPVYGPINPQRLGLGPGFSALPGTDNREDAPMGPQAEEYDSDDDDGGADTRYYNNRPSIVPK